MFTFKASAQNKGTGKITGRIIDSISGKAIDYASIGLLSELNNKEVNGTTSDDKGFFTINNIAEGKYKVIVYYIGYKNAVKSNVEIRKTEPVVNLGNFIMVNVQTTLQEVTITAKTEIIENKIDKVVYNAENDITSQGGAAIDVLRKVPQITVDIDGNVELQGNSNIRFLINGKPSSIFGNSLADALASIPASQIKSIEAITSPGAKYDAQGTGGIINIILKENKVKGINGNVNISAGTRFETGSLNLNLRNSNFGVNAFFSGNAQISSRTPNSQDRYSNDTSSKTTTHLMQNGYTDFERNGYRSGLGFDWNINKKNNFTGSATYNTLTNQNIGFIDQQQTTQNYSNQTLQDINGYRNSNSRSVVASLDWNLNYKKTFIKEGRELNLAYVSSSGRPLSTYVQTQSYAGASTPYTGNSSSNPGTDNSQYLSLDYVHRINKDITIETGLKTSEQIINSNTSVDFLDPATDLYVYDPLQSYHLRYDMKIYAGYVSSTFTLFKWLNVRAGARSEYTDIMIDYPNTVVPAYNIVAPSLILSRKFSKERVLKFSYTRRIERAEYSDLNPFLNLSDPHNLVTGNPKLKPEIGDNMELGYSKNFENGGNIYVALIERINSQDHKSITTFYSAYKAGDSTYTNVSVNSRQNIGTEYNSGGSISASVPVTEKFNIRGNANITNRYIVSTIYVGNISMGVRCRFNLNLSYKLPKDLIIEAFGNYNSPAKNIQGKNPQSITYTIAFRKQFWHRNASFGFTCTNPFNKYVKQVTTVSAVDYTSYSIKELPYRSFGISFTYKFGKLEFKKGKEETNEYLNGPPAAN
ncbi:MAG: TonB-dependent receptor [Bacteroidetes bacterium]|nr:TonB-dependent receptor [Bacteroidota bacterium]